MLFSLLSPHYSIAIGALAIHDYRESIEIQYTDTINSPKLPSSYLYWVTTNYEHCYNSLSPHRSRTHSSPHLAPHGREQHPPN
jgi:hypothetical protein